MKVLDGMDLDMMLLMHFVCQIRIMYTKTVKFVTYLSGMSNCCNDDK